MFLTIRASSSSLLLRKAAAALWSDSSVISILNVPTPLALILTLSLLGMSRSSISTWVTSVDIG